MSVAARQAVLDLVREADAAFASGDAEAWAGCFAHDGRMLQLHNEAVIGRTAIRERFATAFVRFDTSAWDNRVELVELHGDHADVLSTYTERLLDRDSGTRTLVRGRLVYWLRREPDEGWRIALLMNSHSHPMEPIE